MTGPRFLSPGGTMFERELPPPWIRVEELGGERRLVYEAFVDGFVPRLGDTVLQAVEWSPTGRWLVREVRVTLPQPDAAEPRLCVLVGVEDDSPPDDPTPRTVTRRWYP